MKHYSIKYLVPAAALMLLWNGCRTGASEFDATGTFEAREVIVSAEAAGRILVLTVEEGQELAKGARVGTIDSTQLYLTLRQLRESQRAVLAGRPDTRTQMDATRREIESTKVEQHRIENLVKADVATQKQLDDVNAKLRVLEARLSAQQSSLSVTHSTLNEQSNAISAQIALIQDQLRKCTLTNPVSGTVLTQYAMQDEVTGPGKPLYKIADLSLLTLRAYVSGAQLPSLKLGQAVKVFVDADAGSYKEYGGTVTWIADKAEFTPKTIQTKEERANLVYAVKINVPNDGYLKIGMYGEVKFN
jgi:HlyD family secretion protein